MKVKMMNAPVEKNLIIYSSSDDLNFLILFKLFMNVDYQFYPLLFLEAFLEIHEKSILFLVMKKIISSITSDRKNNMFNKVSFYLDTKLTPSTTIIFSS